MGEREIEREISKTEEWMNMNESVKEKSRIELSNCYDTKSFTFKYLQFA